MFRTEETLTRALDGVRALKQRLRACPRATGKRFNSDLLEAVELGFLLEMAEVTVVGALNRKESRGGHAREDYPKRDDVNYMMHDGVQRRAPTSSPTSSWATSRWFRLATSRWSVSTDDRNPGQPAARSDEPPLPPGAGRSDHDHAEDLPLQPENPDAQGFESFRVPALPTDRLLNLLLYVKGYLDGTLTFRRSYCTRRVRFGRDARQRRQPARLQTADEGLPAQGLVKELTITVEPIKGLPVEKISSSTWSRSSTRTGRSNRS